MMLEKQLLLHIDLHRSGRNSKLITRWRFTKLHLNKHDEEEEKEAAKKKNSKKVEIP